jgi:hypothetical protein
MIEPTLINANIRKRLPTRYYTEIGRIVFGFAHLEAHLFHMTYTIMGVDRREAFLAVRKLRAAEQATLIRDLAKLKHIPLMVKWDALKAS